MCSRGKNIRVKENLENKGANGNSNNAGCWRDSPGLVAAESPSLRTLRGGAPVASQRPLGSSALKKGKLQAECWDAHTDQSKRRGTRDRAPQTAALALPLRFCFLLFLPLLCCFSPETGSWLPGWPGICGTPPVCGSQVLRFCKGAPLCPPKSLFLVDGDAEAWCSDLVVCWFY